VNCSFPYTYNGGLYYRCIENMTGVSTAEEPFACVNVNATRIICKAAGEYQTDYKYTYCIAIFIDPVLNKRIIKLIRSASAHLFGSCKNCLI